MVRCVYRLVLPLLIASTWACGDSDATPELSNLSVEIITAASGTQVEKATRGESTKLTGTIDFVDADGDLKTLFISFLTPNGIEQVVDTPIAGVEGLDKGSITVGPTFTPLIVGPHEFEFWVTDKADNESNHLSITVQVQDP